MDTASAPRANALATSAPDRIPPDTINCTSSAIPTSARAWAASRTAGQAGSGLWGQAGLGLLLGAIWSPCVGPTLGAASLLASQGKDLAGVALTMAAFGIGAAAPLLIVGSLSRGALQKWRGGLSGAAHWGRWMLGGGMTAVGLLALSGLDHAVEAALVAASPAWLTQLTSSI